MTFSGSFFTMFFALFLRNRQGLIALDFACSDEMKKVFSQHSASSSVQVSPNAIVSPHVSAHTCDTLLSTCHCAWQRCITSLIVPCIIANDLMYLYIQTSPEQSGGSNQVVILCTGLKLYQKVSGLHDYYVTINMDACLFTSVTLYIVCGGVLGAL